MHKYNYKIISVSVAMIGLFILGIIGLTYAFFMANVEGNQNATDTVIETADLRLVYNDTQIITMNNALPGTTSTKTFTVQNIGNVNISYDITIINVTNTFVDDELVYTITSDNGGGSITNEPMPAEEDILLSSSIDPGITQTYTIEIKFKETGANQNANQNASFSGKLQIDAGIKYVTLGGYVYDENENVLPNVTVEMHSDPIITTTNAEGYYEIENISTGKHTIYIKNGEEILGTKTINIKQNEEASINNKTLKIPSEYKNVNIKVEEELDINIIKQNGLLLWKNSIGGSNIDQFEKVLQTTDGGYIAAGYSYSKDISGLTNKGYTNAIIVKYNSSGTEVWKKNFGGSGSDNFQGVTQTTDGGSIAAGYSSSTDITGLTNKGSTDAIIVKYDSSGTEVWKKNFGGSSYDYFQSVTQTADGGSIAVGYSSSTNISGLTNKGSEDAIIVKYDSSGTEVWKKNFGGSETDRFQSVTQTTDGGYIAVGKSSSTNISGLTNKGSEDAIIVKYDSSGTEVWKKNFGGNSSDNFQGVTQTTDGEYIALGYSNSTDIADLTNKGEQDAIIVKYNSSGTEVWKKNFGGSEADYFLGVAQTADGGCIALGYSNSTDIAGLTNKGGQDAIIVKYNSSATEVWKKNFGGSEADRFQGVVQTTDGGYVAVGRSSSTDIAGIINKGSWDAIIVAFSK